MTSVRGSARPSQERLQAYQAGAVQP